jgi:hypothetical protein
MMNRSLILLAVNLSIAGYAQTQPDECCPLLPPEPIESCQLPVGHFWPAQYTFNQRCADISVAGEFLYWEVNRDSSCYFGSRSELSTDGLETLQTILVHHQGYKPGFKVAAGIGIPQFDHWSVNLEYTWFHHESTNHFNATPRGFIFPRDFLIAFDPALFFISPASSLRSKLRLNLDFMQLTMGRPFYLAQRLIVDAGIGLKSWWSTLHSDLLYNLLSGLQGTQKTDSKLWGIGPYVQAQIKGVLWCGTYLHGMAGIWIPYTRFTRYRGETNFPGVQTPNGFVPALDNVERNPTFYYTTQLFYEGAIGLGWGTYLCGCDYHVDLLIKYDMMTNFIAGYTYVMGSPHKEFYYQGLSIRAQFDF